MSDYNPGLRRAEAAAEYYVGRHFDSFVVAAYIPGTGRPGPNKHAWAVVFCEECGLRLEPTIESLRTGRPRCACNRARLFWSKVVPEGMGPAHCWLWTGSLSSNGYGQFAGRGAHREAYELIYGEIPEDLQIDHVRARGCRNKHCVNPAHLEVVPCQLNILRGSSPASANAEKTHCKRGHILAGENLYQHHGHRHCRTCRAEAASRRRR